MCAQAFANDACIIGGTRRHIWRHQFTNHLISETEFAVSNGNPTYDYRFVINNRIYNEFEFSTLKIALQWSPFSEFEKRENVVRETKSGYPDAVDHA